MTLALRTLAPFAPFALLALLALPARAQVGPFADGELLVFVDGGSPGGGGPIYRIDPLTGDGEVFVESLFAGYHGPAWMAYDPFRGGLLAYTSRIPTSTFQPRLWLFPPDGSAVEIGFQDQELESLTPVGDGRVYLRRAGELSLLDAQNGLVPVLDANGFPVDLDVEHLVYLPEQNVLIGAARVQAAVPCAAFQEVTIHRLPLDADGDQLTGPVPCNGFFTGSFQSPIGIDVLPGGDVLVAYTGGGQFTDEVLLRVDPDTLAITNWAPSSLNDIDGGFFSGALGRAVVLDDVANELRTYQPGQGGAGTSFPVDVPVGEATTGSSTTNKLAEVRLVGSGCAGHAVPYGAGLAGSGGIVPRLTPLGCPTLGGAIVLGLVDAVGGAPGLVAFSATQASVPLFGGHLLVGLPQFANLPVVAGGAPGAPGAGSGQVALPVPAKPALVGVEIYAQTGLLDAGAAAGVSLTAGLAIGIG